MYLCIYHFLRFQAVIKKTLSTYWFSLGMGFSELVANYPVLFQLFLLIIGSFLWVFSQWLLGSIILSTHIAICELMLFVLQFSLLLDLTDLFGFHVWLDETSLL